MAKSQKIFLIFLLFIPRFAFCADQIKIGVCFALTGEAARWSAAQLDGIQLAEEEFKRAGTDLKLLVEDTGTSSQGSVTCFKKLQNVEGVDAVIGNTFGFLTTPMMPLAKQAKIPLVATSVSKSSCPKDNPFFFSVSEQVSDIGDTFYRSFFLKNKEVKTIAIIAFDDAEWGAVNRAAVEGAAKKAGVQVADVFTTQDLKPDFRSVYPRILEKKPDAIFIFHEPLSTVTPLRELKYKGLIVESNAIGEQIWDTGKAADLFEGVYFADIPQKDDFVEKFYKRFGKKPVLEPHSGYDALKVLIESLLENRKDPAGVLHSKIFTGINGTQINFHDSCVGKKSLWGMYKIENGAPVRVD
jgi:ABC-type branched-subunit amino acid transport system substrate-binding protein